MYEYEVSPTHPRPNNCFLSRRSEFLHPVYRVLFQYIHNLGEFWVIPVVVLL